MDINLNSNVDSNADQEANTQKRDLIVDIPSQTMLVYKLNNLIKTYSVSTGYLGVGELKNSYKTPRGKHQIRAKIGGDAPINAVFVGRRWTGEIYSPALKLKFPDRDWILTRILWLSGLELGTNRLGEVDTMARYIYIHGCPDESPMGIPRSHGCIRMHNQDILELFEESPIGTIVQINE